VVIPVLDLEGIDLELLGAALELHPVFPARTNVHFVQVLHPGHLVMRVWERGAGPTLACGTGACATLVACHLLGLSERGARLDLPGGPLEISWDQASDHLFMTGPAQAVFDGVVVPGLVDAEEPPPQVSPELAATAAVTAAVTVAATSAATAPPSLDCATACVHGCIRPEACASRAARDQVEALLGGRSLDELVALATNSAESRFRSRLAAEASPEAGTASTEPQASALTADPWQATGPAG
jgi:diaminopimelate epimerase